MTLSPAALTTSRRTRSRRNDKVSSVTVELLEWQTLRPEPGSVLTGRSFADDPAASLLAKELSESGVIEVLEFARGIELRATSYVGRFTVGEITISILPKLDGAPFLNLLRYA